MSGNGSLARTVLGYVDRPWKVFALAFLAIAGVLAITLYEERAQIADAILHRTVTPRLVPEVYEAEAVKLLSATQADATELLSIKLRSNEAAVVSGYDRAGLWRMNMLPQAVFGTKVSDVDLSQIVDGFPVCLDLTAGSEFPGEREAYDKGLRRACAIGIPPITGVLVGVLYVGWDQARSPLEERIATGVMRKLAMRLATW